MPHLDCLYAYDFLVSLMVSSVRVGPVARPIAAGSGGRAEIVSLVCTVWVFGTSESASAKFLEADEHG